MDVETKEIISPGANIEGSDLVTHKHEFDDGDAVVFIEIDTGIEGAFSPLHQLQSP